MREPNLPPAVNLLSEANLYRILRGLDEQMAAETKARGCPCGGQLHRANYPRAPRGLPPELQDEPAYGQRLSFCCALEGCRRRATPPSALFLGQKVYLGAVVTLISVLRQGPNALRLSRLRELVGVSARTVKRWRDWWLKDFVATDFWKVARGQLRTPIEAGQLPLSLLEAFEGKPMPLQLVFLLRFLKPLTSRSAAADLAF